MMRHKGLWYSFGAAFCFGVATPYIKIGVDHVPLFFYESVMSLTALCMLLAYFVFRERHRSWHIHTYWREYLALGIVSSFLPNVFAYLGYHYGYAVNTTVLLRFEVFAVLMFSVFYLHERITHRQSIGLGLGFLGVCVFVYKSGFTFIAGDVYILLATTCFAAFPILVKQLRDVLSTTQLNVIRLAVSVPLFIFGTFLTGQTDVSAYAPYVPFYIMFVSGFGVFVLGASCYAEAVRYWDVWKVVFVAQFGSVFFGYIASVLVLGEQYSIQQVFGALIILFGIVLVLWRSQDVRTTAIFAE